MPNYIFRCPQCGCHIDKFGPVSLILEEGRPVCPECGEKMRVKPSYAAPAVWAQGKPSRG